MDAPEEPLPPVIYTMENKPIVTCECRSAREGAAAVAGTPARVRRPLDPCSEDLAASWMEVWPGRRLRRGPRKRPPTLRETSSRAVSLHFDSARGRACSEGGASMGALPRPRLAPGLGRWPSDPRGPSSRLGVVLSSRSHRCPTPGRAPVARRPGSVDEVCVRLSCQKTRAVLQ